MELAELINASALFELVAVGACHVLLLLLQHLKCNVKCVAPTCFPINYFVLSL